MPIQFTCPHCGVQTQVDDQFAGQTQVQPGTADQRFRRAGDLDGFRVVGMVSGAAQIKNDFGMCKQACQVQKDPHWARPNGIMTGQLPTPSQKNRLSLPAAGGGGEG